MKNTTVFFAKPSFDVADCDINQRWGGPFLLGLHADSHELGPTTQTRLRHRSHHLPTVRRDVDPPRGDRGPRGDHPNSRAPGLANPRSTTRPGPARRVHADRLISSWIPVQCLSQCSPFAHIPVPHTTRDRHAWHQPSRKTAQARLAGYTACRTAD